MADSLASILAGVPSDPTQQPQGIGPMLMQAIMAQRMGQQPGQMPPQQMPGAPQMPPQAQGSQIGSMGQMALPMMAGAY